MRRATREIWARRVKQWAQSGLGAEAFAAREGVSPRTLAWWRWRLRREREWSIMPPCKPAFVEISPAIEGAAANPLPAASLELVVRDGVRIVVPAGFDPDALRAVLHVVEGR